MRREEIAITRSYMTGRGGARAAAQHQLIAHELAVVFANQTGSRLKSRVRSVGACRPFPHVSKHLEMARMFRHPRMEYVLVQERSSDGGSQGCNFPFGLGRQTCTRPVRKRVSLVVA